MGRNALTAEAMLGGANTVGRPVLSVARDFARFPGPRNKDDGPKSGEEFRDDFLVPRIRRALEAGESFVVDLDGARGYTASFLDEAFGGLVRNYDFKSDELLRTIEIRVTDPSIKYWAHKIPSYIKEARPQAG